MPETVSADILTTPVEGLNLGGAATLADALGERPTLMVFLRHFGCAFCREMVRDLRKLSADVPGYPPVLFFFTATVDEGRVFFGDHWPEARAVSDAPKRFYTAMGIRRATMGQMFGIQVWTCHFRAFRKGNFVGMPIGDPWIMPGAFLVHGGDVLWSHHFQHQGDLPDWRSVPAHVPAVAAALGN